MKDNKKKYFFIPKPHLKHLSFLFFFVIAIAKDLIQDTIEESNSLSYPFFKVYIYIISDFLSIIPYLIIKIRTKDKKSDSNSRYFFFCCSKKKDLIYVNQEKQINRKNILNILLLASLDYIAQISMLIYYLLKNEFTLDIKEVNLNSLLIFNIIFIISLSKLMLHTRFFRHHYFSCLIIILILSVLVVLDIIQINKDKDNKLLSNIYLILRVFRIFLYSFEDVIGKVILLYQYFTPYSLLLNKAIIQIILSIIFSFPFIFIDIKDEGNKKGNIFPMIGNIFDDKLNILKYFFFAMFSFFYNILCWQIIDHFSPNHFCIAEIFENFGLLIINLIKKSIDVDGYLRIIMYILLIITSCIYNEFLVINICGLSKDTKLFLEYKEEEDNFLVENIIEENNLGEKTGEKSKEEVEQIEMSSFNPRESF